MLVSKLVTFKFKNKYENSHIEKYMHRPVDGKYVSCDVLDVEPLDSYTEDGIFTDANLTESYVTMNYTNHVTDGVVVH